MIKKEDFIRKVDDIKPILFEISEYVFNHPEMGFEEFKTSRYLMEILRKNRFDVRENVAGLSTAFHAKKGNGSLKIGLLCEYDAVSPSLGHACGHNIIAASSVGTALILAELTEQFDVSIEVFGTPAEEEGGGKAIMAEAGVFNDVDVVYYMHPSYNTRIGGRSLATRIIDIEIVGTSSHATRSPQLGKNALSALISIFHVLDSARQHLPQSTKVNGIITEGGESTSTIPHKAKGRFQLFSLTKEELDDASKMLERVAKGICDATGTACTIQKGPVYLPRLVNNKLSSIMEKNMRELGLEVEEMSQQEYGYTDVGNVSHVVPTVQGYISLRAGIVQNHTDEFRHLVINENGRQALLEATKVMVATGIDIIQTPSIIKEIYAEFNAKNRS